MSSLNRNNSVKRNELFLRNFSTVKIKGRNIKEYKKTTKKASTLLPDNTILCEHYVQFFFLS